MRSSAMGAIPALSMPPIIMMPTVVSMRPGDSPSSRTYCCATSATNGPANNRARNGATRDRLRKSVSQGNGSGKSKQEK